VHFSCEILCICTKKTVNAILSFITHAGMAAGGGAFSRVCLSALEQEKPLKLSTPNLAYDSSRSASIDPEVKRSRSHGTKTQNRHGRMVASDHRYCVILCHVRPLPAWDCMSIQLPVFSSLTEWLFTQFNEQVSCSNVFWTFSTAIFVHFPAVIFGKFCTVTAL